MQIKNNHSNYLQNPWLTWTFKVLITLGCLYFLISKLRDQPISLDHFFVPNGFVLNLTIVIALMIVNWYLEALRWKISVDLFEEISMNDACRAVLGGLALNWVFPLTSGDLLARISQQKDKYQATSAVILNRGIMLMLTLLFGLYGISFLAIQYDFNGWFLLVILFGIPLLRILFRKSINRFSTYFQELAKSLLIKVVALSLLRYGVFVFQFYLLLVIFLPSLSANLLIGGIGWVFLIRSALPLFFGGIGVREASGILFFEPHVDNLQLIIVPVFLIWVINTIIPSLVGLFFILKMKSSK
ncbi:hypothetical protein [Ekhidna sp.]|uniref:hypothetical protein n=1 Tax=Ekhidna sp. TaxID=2608089 RepID=UPI003299B15D